MAEANQSRTRFVPRKADTRTPIIAMAELIAKSSEFANFAESVEARLRPAYTNISASREAYSQNLDLLVDMLQIVPAGDDRDILILAGHASMLADMLSDHIVENDPYGDRLARGLIHALQAITATIANTMPADVSSIEPINPELASFIRRDIAAAAARADYQRGA